MAFMHIETDYGVWLLVEVSGETHYVPPGLVSIDIEPGQTITADAKTSKTDEEWADIVATISDYVNHHNANDPDEVTEIEAKECWGARYSAPGYMDCTDWVLGDSEEEAVADCKMIYGEEEEEDMDEEEDETECDHDWSEIRQSRFGGNPHRECTLCGEVTLDLDGEQEVSEEE